MVKRVLYPKLVGMSVKVALSVLDAHTVILTASAAEKLHISVANAAVILKIDDLFREHLMLCGLIGLNVAADLAGFGNLNALIAGSSFSAEKLALNIIIVMITYLGILERGYKISSDAEGLGVIIGLGAFSLVNNDVIRNRVAESAAAGVCRLVNNLSFAVRKLIFRPIGSAVIASYIYNFSARALVNRDFAVACAKLGKLIALCLGYRVSIEARHTANASAFGEVIAFNAAVFAGKSALKENVIFRAPLCI